MNITLSDAQWEKVNRDLGLVHSPNDDTTETRTSKNPEGHAHQNASQSGSKTSDARYKGSRIPVRRRAELPKSEHSLSLPEGTEISLSPPLIHPFHPADELNRLLLKQNPTARIVVTEDKDWISAIDEDTDQFPPADKLCARVLERRVIRYDNDGTVFLESTQSPESSLRLAADGKTGYAGPGPVSQSMKTSSHDMKLEDLKSDDIVLMCIGLTETGKSTFIDHLCRQPKTRGSHLNSCTREVEMVRINDHPTYRDRIVIVDTPGFNDMERSDMETLGIISEWLQKIYSKHIPLSGMLYMQRISDYRISGSQQRGLDIFQGLCGIEVARNVMFVTTMWDEVGMDFAEKNEEELKRSHWRSMIDCGASTERFWNTSQSALDVVNSFLKSHTAPAVPLKVQHELVDMKQPVAGTRAAQALYPQKRKVAVLLLGLTGDGKSTFVNAATGNQDAEVNNRLTSTDFNIREFLVDYPNDFTTLVLIDTPGINNLIATDKHLLRTIINRLNHSMFKDVSFGGIIYLRDITQERRMAYLMKLSILKLLLGSRFSNQLLMAITTWDTTTMEEGTAMNEATPKVDTAMDDTIQMFLERANTLESQTDKGACMGHFDGTQSSAWKLIDLLLDREPLELDVAIQELEIIHDLLDLPKPDDLLPPPILDNSLALTTIESELLLLVFIHGFKGMDEIFGDFPKRMEHLLSETISEVKIESIAFPAYETKEELDKAVVRFADWLTTLVVEREVASSLGAGKAKVVLCGHSMGGLLAADTLREFVQSRPDKDAPLWPKIVACIAYDTPYLGLHPFVVKSSVTKAPKYANAATTMGSVLLGSLAGLAGWTSAAVVGGAIFAGAAAGVAYYKKEKDDLTGELGWASDHLKYVGNLWDTASLEKRVDALVDIERDHGVIFRTLYTVLPPNPPEFLTFRTFVALPKFSSRAKSHFLPARNSVATDEIGGHVGMFSGSTNDGYYQLGLDSVGIIRDAIMSSKGMFKYSSRRPGAHPSTKEDTATITSLIDL